MASNLPNSTSSTEKYFNGYFNQGVHINTDVYNQVYAFFLANTSSSDAAQQLSRTVMILTYNNSLDPVAILKNFKKANNASELKTLLITFFNGLRGPTSKIGFSNAKNINQWVERNIQP